MLLVSGLVSVPKPLSQIQRSTRWLLQGLSPRPSFGGFGFTGDGGFWYHIAELETALRYGINTVTVVNNNHSLNQEKRGTERIYAGQPGNSDEVWRFLDVDFAKLAQAIGCFGVRVETPDELGPALERAFASGLPAVIDVASDIEGIAPAPWSG